MPFLTEPKPIEVHICSLPHCRWLPWLIVPRWRKGARWQCGYRTPDSIQGSVLTIGDGWSDGCGRTWRWDGDCWMQIGAPYSSPDWSKVRPPSAAMPPRSGNISFPPS